DAEPRPLHGLAAAEGIDALAQRGVGGPGQVEPLADPVRVDRDDPAGRVDQRAAGRARGERRGVLDAAADLGATRTAGRSLDARDEAGGDPGRAVAAGPQPEDGVADGGIGVREGQRGRAGGVDVDDREIAVRVDAADRTDGGPAVAERDGDLVAAEIVGGGQDAAGGHDDAAAADPAADANDAAGSRVGDRADGGGELFEGGHGWWMPPDDQSRRFGRSAVSCKSQHTTDLSRVQEPSSRIESMTETTT